MDVEGRCMRCKTNRKMKDVKEVIMKGKVKMKAAKGVCTKCDCTMYKILGKA
ncbi:MAG: hypothetical protein QF486_03390 [Candidatus Woesearchaeota archaeon]|jgi:hypothetical protein|nr:hypothetical protein [Candidatus Woesearchaeota archaeon]MDP7181598.1 hypothetical protein [Candidatus Woesearchaeota archaeon]MDP7198640.1 hypothetical protein [Candidatus Woesearchaeota archaeon]MDP7466618.1 hypothetical protein [Candidatus Woesearchaeota archaeon]MDP7646874.1 hypothetical protein [Candidatus Woesearchaeota archaeon]